ncbi:MAG: hypothetical protein J6E43_02320 [Prevotella sp.]|nr:hypothetical protein [Prevotella sp.]
MKLAVKSVIVMVLLHLSSIATAQEIIEVVDSISEDEMVADTISIDELMSDKPKITQYDLKEFEWVDICYNPKYAIVSKDGKKGIYDMMLHKNVTEIEYRDLGFSKQTVAEDSAYISMFYATRGIKRGIVSIYEPTNNVVSIWMDDPDELYSLDECTTIDKKITRKATKLLDNLMESQQMENAQIVILDAKSGRLKTWVRLDRDMDKDEAGKLLVHSCTGSLTKPFHTVMALENDSVSLDCTKDGMSYRQAIKSCNNQIMLQAIRNGYRRSAVDRVWRELTDTKNSSTSPFILAVGYNSLANNGTMIIPTMKADSVNLEENVFSPSNIANLKDVLWVDRVASPQLAWLSTDTEWLGYATAEDIYEEEDKEHAKVIGKQIAFAGCFPVEEPRYTICIVGDKYDADVAPSLLQEVVNPLAKWLLKRK